ncbi:MAG: S49 family peptidase [Pikeienuella sp.]
MLSTLKDKIARPPLISVIRLSGAIGGGGLRSGLNDAALAPQIARAFAPKRLAAVALAINSPGGSPTQSALIAARIRRLAAERNVKVYAFCEDVAASGGYWLATAGDEIYADDNSIIGSIGVIYAGFGFQGLIEKYGVERRVHTAGGSKSMLDPFKPEQEKDITRLKALQEQIHQNFIRQVKDRRGAKLADADLFTGDVWVGQQAHDVGLIDGVAHLVPKMKATFGDKVRFNVVGQKRSLFQRLGAPGVEDVSNAIEERALRAQFGL